MTNTAGTFHHVPTSRQRFWRALGFRYRLGDEPEGVDALEGWSRTDTTFRFNFVDRLRLLLRGELRTVVVSHYNAPSPDVIKNRVDFHIVPPGGP